MRPAEVSYQGGVQVKPSELKVLDSGEDRSVNWVEEQLVGFLESRYVRKVPEYFIAYLSSQTGCNRGCTFCHLTTTGQTAFENSTPNDFVGQATKVLQHYRRQNEPAKFVHFNFMARGEPLANAHLLSGADGILSTLGSMARSEGLGSKFNISTIMPATFKQALTDVFRFIHPTVYYSLYSVDEGWRKHWMPGAASAREALAKLAEYQKVSKKVIKVHHPLIQGQNDGLVDAARVVETISDFGLDVEFNLVRYNPASPDQGRESDERQRGFYMDFLRRHWGERKVKEIPRVGHDVKASCGMFVGG